MRVQLDSFAGMGAAIARICARLLPAWVAILLLCAPPAGAQPSTPAKADRAVVHLGDSEAAIVKLLGPGAVVEGADRTFMMYPEGRIVLENNHAVEIPPALRAPAETPPPVVVEASPPPVAVTAPSASPPLAASTPAQPAPTPPAKPAVTAAPAEPAKSAVLPVTTAVTPEAAKFAVPSWVWVSLVLALILGGLKYWDYRSKNKSAPSAEAAGGEAPLPGSLVREDVPVASVDPTMPSEMVTQPLMEEPPPEPEPVRVKIGLRPALAEEAPPPEAGEPVTGEAPRSLRLTRKAPGPAAGDKGKG